MGYIEGKPDGSTNLAAVSWWTYLSFNSNMIAYAMVCSLKEFYEVGDHYLYICDVEQVYGNEADEALFAWNGYAQVRPAK